MRYVGSLKKLGVPLRLAAVLSVLAVSLSLAAVFQGPVGANEETSFVIAQVPDTQNEVLQANNPLMPGRYQWLVNNREALNLKFIAHSGDVVNWGHLAPEQFDRAKAATQILNNSPIPFMYAIGNHDTAAVDVGGSAAPGNVRNNLRNTTAFNQNFPLSGFKNVGGVFEAGKVDNVYQTFSAGGVDWLVITHEMWPRQAVVNWMRQVAAAHPRHNIIANTHAYIDGSGGYPAGGYYGDLTPQQVWTQFYSQYPNIRMILSAHHGPNDTSIGAAYSERTGANGNKIAQIMTAYHSNYQNHVRLLSINTAGNTISSTVYVATSRSPGSYPTGYINDAYSNFTATNMNWIWPEGSSGPGEPPAATVPSAPHSVSATAGNGGAAVSFAAPQNNGGLPVISYTVRSNPGNITATGTGSPITVSGLTNGTPYTFTVTAANAVGSSQPSAASAAVTPAAAPPAAELLPDPGFEQGDGGWIPFSVGNFTRPTNPVRSGSRALNIAPVSSTTTLVGMTQNNVIANSVAGREYTVRCYVRPTNSGRNVTIRFLEYTQNYSSNVNIGTRTYTNLPANTWTLVEISGTATASGRRVIPQVYSTNLTTSTGTMNYDDCSVFAGQPATVPGTPSSPTVTAGVGQVALSWDAPAADGGSAIVDYAVQYAVGSSNTWTTFNDGISTTTATVVSGLTNGTSYRFRVAAVNSVGTGGYSAASAAATPVPPPPTAPDVPTNVSAVAGSTVATVSFTGPTNNGGSPVTGYIVESSPGDIISTGTGSPITVTGLTNGVSYVFTVTAVNAVGEGEHSAPSNAVTPATMPGAPTGIEAAAGNASATVSFEAPADNGGAPITSYTVTSSPGSLTATGSGSPIAVTGLTNGIEYTFTVTAVNAAGSSESSAASEPVTPATVPDAPTNLMAVSEDGQATLTWETPGYDGGASVTDYIVRYRVNGSAIWVAYDDGVSDETSATVYGLDNFLGYDFTVLAVNRTGTGSASAAATAPAFELPPPTVPSSPTNVSALAGDASAAVSFDAPESDGGIAVTHFTVISNPGGIIATGTTSPIIVTGLTNGVSYTFTVMATNSVGDSEASSASNAVTPATLPGTPANLVATPGNGQATLTWDAPEHDGGSAVTDYIVQVAQGGSAIWVAYSDGVSVSTAVTVTGLTNGTSYRFRVAAVNSIGTGAYSAASGAVTPVSPITVPGAPTGVTAVAGNGSAIVSFTPPANNGGAPITSYTVTRSPGSVTTTGTGSPITVSGLTNGTAYTFTVRAANSVGTGPASAASGSVTPSVPSLPNLLSDPGFESGNGGWIPFSVGTFTRPTNPVRSGSRVLNIAPVSNNVELVGMTHNSVISNSVTGREYTVRCYVRPTNSGRNVTIRFLQYPQNFSGATHIGTRTYANLPANTWTLIEISATATASGQRVIPQIYSTNLMTSSGTMNYDDCSVTAG